MYVRYVCVCALCSFETFAAALFSYRMFGIFISIEPCMMQFIFIKCIDLITRSLFYVIHSLGGNYSVHFRISSNQK